MRFAPFTGPKHPIKHGKNAKVAKSTRVCSPTFVSGLQKGPAERGHVKKRQNSSKSVKKFFDTFRQFSRRAKNVKNRQKTSKSFSTLFDNFRAAPFFRPLLGGSPTFVLQGSPVSSWGEVWEA